MARRQPGGKRSKGKKNRKHGRNKESCNLYRQQNRRERNKALRLARHLRHHPTDQTARAALRGLPMDGALTPSGVTYPHEPPSDPDVPFDRPSGALAAPAPRSPGDYPLGGDGVCGGGSGDPTRHSGVWASTPPGPLLGHRILKFRKWYYNSDRWRPAGRRSARVHPRYAPVGRYAAQAKKDPGEPGPRHEETERLLGVQPGKGSANTFERYEGPVHITSKVRVTGHVTRKVGDVVPGSVSTFERRQVHVKFVSPVARLYWVDRGHRVCIGHHSTL